MKGGRWRRKPWGLSSRGDVGAGRGGGGGGGEILKIVPTGWFLVGLRYPT